MNGLTYLRCTLPNGLDVNILAKWTWDPILTALDIRDLPVNTRNEVVIKGLRFWKRPIIKYSKANNYLGSIFKEGGFPHAC